MAARVVGGRYQLGREIGRGGFGRVHLARDLRDARQLWAVKELTLDLSNPGQAEQVRSFFDQEQKILSWLSHPAIVRRQEAIAEGSTVYLVMEYVDGVTLEEILRRYPDPLPQGMVLSIGEQVAEILAYLHSQKPHPIIFRDLKPSNLMVTPTGKLKLIDFGIARLHNRDSQVRLTAPMEGDHDQTVILNTPGVTLVLGKGQDTCCMGTPGYAAPEQYPGSGVQTDSRADLYALGVMLHQLLTRENPRRFKPPIPPARRFNAAVDQELEKILVNCTMVDREQRVNSARTLARSLGSFRDSRLKTTSEKLRGELGKLVMTLFTPPPMPEEKVVEAAFQEAVAHNRRVKQELVKPVVVHGPTVPWALVVILAVALGACSKAVLSHYLSAWDNFGRLGVPAVLMVGFMLLFVASAPSEAQNRSRLLGLVLFGIPGSIFFMLCLSDPHWLSWLLVLALFLLTSRFG